MRRLAFAVAAAGLTIAACGGDTTETELSDPAETESGAGAAADDGAAEAVGAPGIRLVTPEEAAAIQSSPPEGLVILDVRTPEEFETARLDGSTMIDFYEADFADQLAGLDRDVPYLLYCRSGNRSGQTRAIMESLGFTDVADVDGGIVAWEAGGHPLIAG